MEKQKLLKKKNKAVKEGNLTLLSTVCTDLAEYYMKEENFYEAIKEYEILADTYKKQNKMINFATVQRGLGTAYLMLMEYNKAVRYQKIYLELSKKHENMVEQQRALATLGHTYLTKFLSNKDDENDLIEAQNFTVRSLEICGKLTDIKKYDLVDMKARLYNNLGLIKEYQGNFKEGMELFNKAISLCRSNDVFDSLYQAYNSLASLLERRKEYNVAIQNYNLAIDTAKKLKNSQVASCDSLVSKANILLNLNDISGAKKCLSKAYKLKVSEKMRKETRKRLKNVLILYKTEKEMVSKTISNSELQKCYEKMGDGFSNLGCYDQAIEFYQKMLNMAEKEGNDLALCYYSLAATYKDSEQYDKAIEYYEKEYLLCDFKKGLDTLCEIADIKEINGSSYKEVIQVYERAIKNCVTVHNQREEGRMLSRLMDYLQRSKHTENIDEYDKRFLKTGFVPTDSEDSPQNSSSEDNISDLSDSNDSVNSDNEIEQTRKRSKGYSVRRNLRGESQLHTACISGKLEVIKHLLKQGHPVNIRDNSGWLPLHDACIYGHYEVVKLLLDNGAAINDRGGTLCNGTTPLHDAAVNAHLDVVELLLDRGASVLAKTGDGETPYHYLRKSSLQTDFDEESRKKCNFLLQKMSFILDKAGQSKDVNIKINSNAFISDQGREEDITLRKNKFQDTNRSSREFNENIISDEDNEELIDDNDTHKSQATDEYRTVMENLKRKSYSKYNDIEDTVNSKKSAFVEDDLDDENDWLDNDIDVRVKKKRKLSLSNHLTSSSNIKADGKFLKRNNSEKSISSGKEKSPRKVTPPKKNKRISDHKENSFDYSTKYIDKMMGNDYVNDSDAGFTEYSDKCSQQAYVKSSQNKLTRTSSSPKISPLRHNDCSLIGNDPMLAMDVNIEGRTFRVTTRSSLKETLTVKWLALEAARRYAKKEYVEPVLELSTENGAELVDDDLIGTLFVTDSQIVAVKAKVLRWTSHAIQEKYKEACSELDTEPLKEICQKLEATTITLSMKNAGYQSKEIAPLCKAILRENRLMELNLSNNFLSLNCITMLAYSLPTLKNLKKLNLSCINLQPEGLRILANMFTNSSILFKLCSLDLSENFLTDECLQDIATIINNMNLKELNLSLLNFTKDLFKLSYNKHVTFNLRSVEVLNLNGNNLGNDALLQIISFTSGEQLKNLDVSNNQLTTGFVKSLIDFLKNQNQELNLNNLNLSHCEVFDSEVYDLLRNCAKLETVNLSYSKITSLSLRRFLECPNIQTLHLIGCDHINDYFDESSDGWLLEGLKPKSIRITVNKDKFPILIKLWNEKYSSKFNIYVEEKDNLLILR